MHVNDKNTCTKTPISFADISVDVPDNLDLSSIQGRGLQSGEDELPQEAEAPQGKDISD